MRWTDATSYSQGDKIREPRVWQLYVPAGGITVIVHRYIDIPDTWFLTCREFSIDTHQLNEEDDIERAQSEALVIVKEKAAKIIAKYKLFLEHI
jgi:hypothetical protein